MTPRFLAIATIAATLALPAMAHDKDKSANAMDPKTLSSQQVKDVQQALKDKGELQGQADGVWGPQSEQALKSFQKEQNMKSAKGELDDQTISALGLNASEFQNAENGGASTSAGGSTSPSSTNSSSSYGTGSSGSSSYNSNSGSMGSSSGSMSKSPSATSPNSSSNTTTNTNSGR